MSSRYLITAPWVMPRPGKFIANGAVLIEDNRIIQISRANKISAGNIYQLTHISQKDCLLMPGLVNAHCHLELTGLADLCPVPGTVEFIDWIISVIDAKKETPAKTFMNGLTTGQQLLLESGTTCVGDLRSPEIFHSPEAQPSILRAVHFLEIIGRDAQQLQIPVLPTTATTPSITKGRKGIAVHSPYTVSLPLLKQLVVKAGKLKLPVTIHLGESMAENRFFCEGHGPIAEKLYPHVGWQDISPTAYGRDSIDLLLEKQLIHNLSAVHLGTAHRDQLKQFAQLSITPIICLRSNQTLGNPLPDLETMLDYGLSPALGTDSLASVSSLSLWDEMRFLNGKFPDIPASNIFEMATLNGAAALNLQNDTGQLEPRYHADMIAVHLQTSSKQPPDLDKLIQHTDSQDIRMVMIGGKIEKNIG